MPSGHLLLTLLPVYLLSPTIPSSHNQLPSMSASLFKKKKNYLFLAVLGLCCCARAFSSCLEWRLLSSCGMQASHCGGFSCCRMWAPGCPSACEIFLDQRSNPYPSALGGGFFTTEPPGKSCISQVLYLAKSSLLNLLVSGKLFPSPASASSYSSDFNRCITNCPQN